LGLLSRNNRGVRELWEPFFTAQVAASAALTGLVFVALSINLARIMQYSQLVHRAAEAVVLLGQPIAVGLAVLAPYRSIRTTGLLAAVPAIACAALASRLL
jgi:modulator of FtsH protease